MKEAFLQMSFEIMKKPFIALSDVVKWMFLYKQLGICRGIYSDFSEAAKENNNIGHNNIGFDSERIVERCLKVHDSSNLKIAEFEYAVFFWLNIILNKKNNLRVFDLGGSLGWHFYKFSARAVHSDFKWIVCEVEKFVNEGKRLTTDERLSFASDFYAAAGCDIFLSSGTLQYIEDFSFSRLTRKPEHVILARVPVQNKVKTFVTYQSIGTSHYSPMYVFNHDDFVNGFLASGYELVDEWSDRFDSCIIPFHRDVSCRNYSGFYFRLKH